jgi:hypothetical protein
VPVADGVLEAVVSGERATITWKSKTDIHCSQSITMRDGTPETTVFGRAASGACCLLNEDPEQLMAYQDRFSGIHRQIDRILSMYKNRVYVRRTSRGSGPQAR